MTRRKYNRAQPKNVLCAVHIKRFLFRLVKGKVNRLVGLRRSTHQAIDRYRALDLGRLQTPTR